MDEIYNISEIATKLNKKPRSAIAWCKRNNITVFDNGTFKYVFVLDFKSVTHKPLIDKLIKKFGDKWQDVYEKYVNNNLVELLNSNLNITVQPSTVRYTAKGILTKQSQKKYEKL